MPRLWRYAVRIPDFDAKPRCETRNHFGLSRQSANGANSDSQGQSAGRLAPGNVIIRVAEPSTGRDPLVISALQAFPLALIATRGAALPACPWLSYVTPLA